MNNRRIAVLSLFLCLALLGGCNEDSGSGTASSRDEAATARWNNYVELFNAKRMTRRAEAYFEAMGTENEPAFKDSKPGQVPIPNLNTWHGPNWTFQKTALERVETVLRSAEGGGSELDKAALAYAKVLKELHECFNEAETYYNAKSYADDAFAKGKEIHTRMLTLYADAMPKEAAFNAAMDERGAQLQREEIASMRSQGMEFVAAALEFSLAGEKAMGELVRQSLTKDTMYEMDVPAFRPFYEELVKGLSALETAGKTADLESRERIDKDRAGTQLSIARELKAAANSIMERAEKSLEHKKKVDAALPAPRSGEFKDAHEKMQYNMAVSDAKLKNPEPSYDSNSTPDQFAWVLNRYIDAYNMLISQRR